MNYLFEKLSTPMKVLFIFGLWLLTPLLFLADILWVVYTAFRMVTGSTNLRGDRIEEEVLSSDEADTYGIDAYEGRDDQ
jgi:hypothetical protein